MRRLGDPSPELAARVLADYDFDRRITGHAMHPRLGINETHLYSLDEATGFLCSGMVQMDFGELAVWLDKVILDPELAGAVRELARQDLSTVEMNIQAAELLGQRLLQCMALSRSIESGVA